MVNRCLIAALLIVGIASSSGLADAETKTIELGVYVPRLMFSNNLARVEYAQAIAATLSETLSTKVRGRAFARHRDLGTFVRAGRLQLVLADAGVVAGDPRQFEIIGVGSGPEGISPQYAVLSPTPISGITALEGQRLVLPDASMRELSLISNLAFEGEIAINRFFGSVKWASDSAEIVGRLRAKRADCTVGYATLGRSEGLKVVSKLKGMPLPMLAAVKGKVPTAIQAKLLQAVNSGLVIPKAGPLKVLVSANRNTVVRVSAASALPPGQRPVRRAVWSPAPLNTLSLKRYKVKVNAKYPMPPLENRWQSPDYPQL